jgi:hypothetical protein
MRLPASKLASSLATDDDSEQLQTLFPLRFTQKHISPLTELHCAGCLFFARPFLARRIQAPSPAGPSAP